MLHEINTEKKVLKLNHTECFTYPNNLLQQEYYGQKYSKHQIYQLYQEEMRKHQASSLNKI